MTDLSSAIACWTVELLDRGYCIIPDALPTDLIGAPDADLAETFDQTPFCHGVFHGGTTNRFGRLFAQPDRAASLVQHQIMLDIAEKMLASRCDKVQLNVDSSDRRTCRRTRPIAASRS